MTGRKNDKSKKTYSLSFTKSDIVWVVSIIGFFLVCLELFYRMIAEYNGKYPSDLHYYAITTILKEEKPVRFVEIVSHALHSINQGTMEFNIFIATVIPAIIILNYLTIRFFLKEDGMDDRTPKWSAQIASMAVFFVGPVFIPVFHEYYYMHSFAAFAWHNPTQHVMMLFSIAGTLTFYKMYLEYEKNGVPLKWWIATMVFVLLSASAKPSFIIEFVLCVVAVFLIELFSGGKEDFVKRFKALFIMGLSIVPAGVYTLWLSTMDFGDAKVTGGKIEVLFGLEQALSHHNVMWIFFYGMPFSIFVLAVNFKRFKDKKYFVALMLFLMGIFQWLFFKEAGPRAKHGNFDWGRMYATYYLALVSLTMLIENVYYPNSIFPDNKKARKIFLIVAFVLLAISVLSQLNYFGYVLSGRKYMR